MRHWVLPSKATFVMRPRPGESCPLQPITAEPFYRAPPTLAAAIQLLKESGQLRGDRGLSLAKELARPVDQLDVITQRKVLNRAFAGRIRPGKFGVSYACPSEKVNAHQSFCYRESKLTPIVSFGNADRKNRQRAEGRNWEIGLNPWPDMINIY